MRELKAMVAALGVAVACLEAVPAAEGAVSTWVGDAPGNWNDPARWNGPVPGAVGSVAMLGASSVPRQIALEQYGTYFSTIIIDSSAPYILNGGTGYSGLRSNYISSVGYAETRIEVRQGSHRIDASVAASGLTEVRVASGAFLTTTSLATRELEVNGGGSLFSESVVAGASLTVQRGSTLDAASRTSDPAIGIEWNQGQYPWYYPNANGRISGTLQLQVPGLLSAPQIAATFADLQVDGNVSLLPTSTPGTRAAAVSVRGAIAFGETGRFDLGIGLLTVRTDVDDSNLRSALARGFANGAWNGFGLMSSRAGAGGPTGVEALALLDSASWQPTLTLGEFALGSSTIIYTYLGDTNGDGVVNATDFENFEQGFASRLSVDPLLGWQWGDFNYDGTVDDFDRALLNRGLMLQGVPLGIAALVPEPAAVGFGIAFTVMGMTRRRR